MVSVYRRRVAQKLPLLLLWKRQGQSDPNVSNDAAVLFLLKQIL